MPRVSSSNTKNAPDGIDVIREVLEASAPRPTVNDSTGEKVKYAVRFADHAARHIAADLSPNLLGISAATSRSAGSVRGKKQLDINFSTAHHGLVLGISLKSVHLRDAIKQKNGTLKIGRYTHNMKRNEEELRIEAGGYHKRQPYAVMIGVLFLPFDSCDDGSKTSPSSFGSWVRHLRPYAGRTEPTNEFDRFEKLYVGLYREDGTDLHFFDIESDPPKNGQPRTDGELFGRDGRPRRLLTYSEFLTECFHAYLRRNAAEFRWADGEEAPLNLEEGNEEEAEETD